MTAWVSTTLENQICRLASLKYSFGLDLQHLSQNMFSPCSFSQPRPIRNRCTQRRQHASCPLPTVSRHISLTLEPSLQVKAESGRRTSRPPLVSVQRRHGILSFCSHVSPLDLSSTLCCSIIFHLAFAACGVNTSCNTCRRRCGPGCSP